MLLENSLLQVCILGSVALIGMTLLYLVIGASKLCEQFSWPNVKEERYEISSDDRTL